MSIGIIGCGQWGQNHVRVLLEFPELGSPVCYDSDDDALEMIRRRYPYVPVCDDLQDLLATPQVDAVIIATPAATHYGLAKSAMVAGKHVLMEKPMTTCVKEAEDLVRIARDTQRVLMVGHVFLYNPAVRKVKEIISSSDFGGLYYIDTTRTNLGPIRTDVNVMWDLASHDIAILNYLLDAVPRRVSAVGAKLLGNSKEDIAFINLWYDHHVLCNIHVSWVDPNKVREVAVVGSQRRVVFDDLDSVEPVRVYERGVGLSATEGANFGEFRLMVRNGDIFSPKVTPREPLKVQCEHFLNCVWEQQQPLTDGSFGLAIVRTLAAMDESMESRGMPVNIRWE